MRATTASSDRTVLGIGLAFLAFAALSGADALTKLLSARYSIFELAAIDAIFATLFAVPVALRSEGLAGLRPRSPLLVIARAALAAVSLILCFLSFARIPLADGYAIAFIAPLAVTALSAPLLGEAVGWRQWMAVVVGFAAAFVILRPDVGAIGLGQLFMLGSALTFALSLLILRRVSGTEPGGALLASYYATVFVFALPSAIAAWRTPSPGDLALIAVMGLCSGGGNLLLVLASRATSASIVSSFMYSQLVWGCLLGLAIFNDLPDTITLAGSAVIIGCGLYTLSHAARRPRLVAEAS